MILPTAPGFPPKTEDLVNPDQAFSFRQKLLCFNNLASLTGHPAAVVPGAPEGSLPMGFQLVGPRGSDRALLNLAQKLEEAGV